jgi:PAS domain S-box-containing protein
MKVSPSHAVPELSPKPRLDSDRRKILVSVLLGLAGFAGSFFSPTFVITPHSISITWYHIFPLLAAMAYGPQYGFLAGVIGLAAFSPFFVWPTNGWANIVPVILYLLFYVWHGYCAKARRGESRYWNNPFIAQILFLIAYGAAIYFLYPLLFSLNPPFWSATAVTSMPEKVILGIILKSTVIMYGCVLAAAFIFATPGARRLLGISSPKGARFNGRILASVVSMVILWFFWRMLNSLFVRADFPQGVFHISTSHEVIELFMVMVICLVGGKVIALFVEKRNIIEDALRESEERFRLLIEQAPEAIVVLDVDENRFVLANVKAEELFGRSREELLKYGPQHFFAPIRTDGRLISESIKENIERILAGEELLVERMIHSADRKDAIYELRMVRLPSADRRLIRNSFIDITKRKQAEEALRQSEDKFRLAFNTSPDSININRLEDGRFVDINQGFTNLTGFTREDVIGRTSLEIDIWHDPADRERLVQGLRERGFCENLEAQFRRKDGSLTTALMSARVLMLEEVPHILSITRDISERKQAEQTLRESEEKYRNILESIEEGYYEVDLAGNLTFFNDPVCKMLGYSRDELMGMNNRQYTDEKNSKELYRVYSEVYRTEKSVKGFEWSVFGKDGTERFGEASVSLMKDVDGRPVGFRGIVRDVTNRKLAEQENQKLWAQLQQAQKMEAIGTLAGGIAHDFNNILTVILGCTELSLLDVPEDNPIYKHLAQVRQAGLRATDLVKQILAFSRQAEQERKIIQPGIIVKEALKMLRASLPSTIQIQQYIGKEQGLVMADPTQIHQILMNLCTNAAQAMREEGGILKVSLTNLQVGNEEAEQYSGLSPGPYVHLTVSDTGQGMTPEVRERIFDPYFTTKAIGEGTGLGLAVVYGIIKSYKGSVKVHSEPGKGSRFEVFLPRMDYAETGAKTEEPELVPGGNEKVLLVDDEEALVYTVRKQLESLGYQVTARTSSQQALEAFRAGPGEFDVLITDMTMPHLTGMELSKQIKQIRSDIPILLCTGFSEMIDEEKAKKLGIQAFLIKPIARREMAETLRKVLDGETGR